MASAKLKGASPRSTRMTDDEWAAVSEASEREGMSPSEYLRDSALARVRGLLLPPSALAGKLVGAAIAQGGVRVARLCEKCMWRQFGSPDAVCGDHPDACFTDYNRPYRGVEPTQAPGFDRAVYASAMGRKAKNLAKASAA